MYYLIIANGLLMAFTTKERKAIKYFKEYRKEAKFDKVELIAFNSIDKYVNFIKKEYKKNG